MYKRQVNSFGIIVVHQTTNVVPNTVITIMANGLLEFVKQDLVMMVMAMVMIIYLTMVVAVMIMVMAILVVSHFGIIAARQTMNVVQNTVITIMVNGLLEFVKLDLIHLTMVMMEMEMIIKMEMETVMAVMMMVMIIIMEMAILDVSHFGIIAARQTMNVVQNTVITIMVNGLLEFVKLDLIQMIINLTMVVAAMIMEMGIIMAAVMMIMIKMEMIMVILVVT